MPTAPRASHREISFRKKIEIYCNNSFRTVKALSHREISFRKKIEILFPNRH